MQRAVEAKRWFGEICRSLLVILSFAFVFFLLQRLTFLLRFPPYERTTLWIPGALTLSVLLVWPTRQWWKFYLGLCLGAYAAYYDDLEIPGLVALLAAQFHFITVAVGCWAIQRFSALTPFSSVSSMMVFVLTAGVLIPLATSIPSEVPRFIRGESEAWPTAIRSFLCIALGMLIGTPALTSALLTFRGWLRSAPWQEKLEGIGLAMSVLVVGLWVFNTSVVANALPALVYAPIPLLLWAALRFEVAGSSWALLAIAYLSTWNAINDRGPFVGGTREDHVLQLQLFLLAVSLPLLLMAAGVRERRCAFTLLHRESEERRRMEDRFRLVVESTPSAILMINAEGLVVLANKQTERLFGYNQQELIGRTVDTLLPQRLRSQARESLEYFFRAPALMGIGSGEDFRGLRTDGEEIPIEIGLTPIESSSGLLALAAVTDNRERQRAEEARRELVHASRLAVMSEFTASIAHEINQPLGAILSNADAAEMLLESPSPPLEEVRRILADIRNDDLRASDVIRKLRSLLRRGEVERVPLEINEIAHDVLMILRSEVQRRGIEVRAEMTTEPAHVLGDRVHLQQVLLNLMINAMEAMAGTAGSKQLTVSTNVREEEVVVAVTDTGPGVSRESRSRLFERFYSTKREGMGMGLAISRSLIEEHGGRLWVDSEEGQGATFHFSLPAQKEHPLSTASTSQAVVAAEACR